MKGGAAKCGHKGEMTIWNLDFQTMLCFFVCVFFSSPLFLSHQETLRGPDLDFPMG